MDRAEAAIGFSAMGSEARLLILRTLVRAGEDGLTVAQVQDRTGIAPSTLTHHLKLMTAAGLILQDRQGRTITSRPALTHLQALATFITDECCADQARKAANDG